MVERNVVLAKIDAIDRCLERIAEVRRRRGLEALDIEEIVLLNLQRAIQDVLDIAQHVVTTERYGLPDTLADSFVILQRHGVLPGDLAEGLKRMVGFRNIIIHRYQQLDPEILESVVENHLDELRAFCKRVTEFFGIERG